MRPVFKHPANKWLGYFVLSFFWDRTDVACRSHDTTKLQQPLFNEL